MGSALWFTSERVSASDFLFAGFFLAFGFGRSGGGFRGMWGGGGGGAAATVASTKLAVFWINH